MAESASILIRTKNEEEHLGSTLKAVYEQSLRPYEVFVIDSESTDATLEVAAQFPVRIVRMSPEGWSYPRALNLGAKQAQGEILVCLSAHCRPISREWLANMLRHFDDPNVAGVWGPEHPVVAPDPSDPPQYQEPGIYGAEYRFWGLSNANSALRRSLWIEVPFDESLPAAEDKAWAVTVLARGYRVVYEPAAAVWHESHNAARAFRRDRAVSAGFKLVFPELGKPGSSARRLASALSRIIVSSLRNPNPRNFWRTMRRLPTRFAGALGAYTAKAPDRAQGPSDRLSSPGSSDSTD